MDISLMYFEADPAHSVFAWKPFENRIRSGFYISGTTRKENVFPKTGARSQFANIAPLQSPHVKAQPLPVILGAL